MGAIRWAVGLACAACLVGVSQALAEPSNNIGVDTTLISRSTAGGLPNGPSSNPVIALDSRAASIVAFVSTATDLVSQPVGGGSNVYFVRRTQPFDAAGSAWAGGQAELASRGMGGQPANGPSSLPAIGADNKHAAGCIAFISAASNLVPHDTNGKPDAFAYFPGSGKTIRVSLRGKKKQMGGAASGVSVNGRCTQFAFADDGQIYVRNLLAKRKVTIVIRRHGHKHRKRKNVIGPLTTLVSKNGNTPAFATATNDLVFTSSAGGHTQIYGVGPRLGRLRLLSATADGHPGDGDSDQPAISQDGKSFAFRTFAPNLGSQGHPRVVYSGSGAPLRPAGPDASADQENPAVANRGHYIVFANGPQVVFWSDVQNQIFLLSRDSQQNPLQLPAVDPSPSEALNYAAFATSDPFADRDFAATQPGWNSDPNGTRLRAAQDPRYHQIYLRYWGGK